MIINKMVLSKFEEVIIELSQSDIWVEASTEWGFLYKKEKSNFDNHCGCGKPLKHQYYYYNNFTKKIICAGDGCKKHIDDHRGNKEYNNNFISDLNSIIGMENVVDYDLQAWCEDNEQRLWDRFFKRIDALMTEQQLLKYSEYLDEMWFELVDLDVILDKIDEKIQEISDREEAEAERRKKAKEEWVRLEKARIIKQEEMVRQQQEYRAKQLKLDRKLMLKVKEAQQKKIIMTKKRRIKECEENIVRIKREILFKDSELAVEEALLLKLTP